MSSPSYDLPQGMDPALAAENPYKIFLQTGATIGPNHQDIQLR